MTSSPENLIQTHKTFAHFCHANGDINNLIFVFSLKVQAINIFKLEKVHEDIIKLIHMKRVV